MSVTADCLAAVLAASASMPDALAKELNTMNTCFLPLTEENLAELQAWFKKRGSTTSAEEKEDTPTLEGHEKKEHDRLKAAVDTGSIDTRSYLGVQFREYMEQNPAEKSSSTGSATGESNRPFAWPGPARS